MAHFWNHSCIASQKWWLSSQSNRTSCFDPSKDDLIQYSQKVEMLAEIWLPAKMNELVTRLMLATSGSAFQKLSLHKDELLNNQKSSVKKVCWADSGVR